MRLLRLYQRNSTTFLLGQKRFREALTGVLASNIDLEHQPAEPARAARTKACAGFGEDVGRRVLTQGPAQD